MLSARPGPRTIIRTLAAWAERNTAPWPAELPPPTRTTSSPAHRRASICDAQYQTPRPSKRAMSAIERMAISCAARDHDRSGLNAIAVLQFHDERPIRARAIERPDGDRDHDVGAEFLRLNEGARGQRLAGDSGRKAEVVFDPGAGPGLPAVGASVENRDRQAFGGRVDRRRQARRAGADHRDVVDEVRARGGRHADLAGERPLRRICEHRAVGANHQRQAAGDIGVAAITSLASGSVAGSSKWWG